LATSLVGELRKLVGIYPGMRLHVDPFQLPVDLRAVSDQLPNERVLDRALLGRGPATPREPDKYDDERRKERNASLHILSSGRRAVDEGQRLRAERVTDAGQAGDDSVAARPFLLLPIFRPALM
jgi:hypothetical protein